MPSDEDTKRLAVALCEVEKHYPMPGISPGRKALGLLAFTAFSVYRPVVTAVVRGELHGPAQAQAPVQVQAPAPIAPAPVAVVPSAADWGFPAGNA